MGAAGGSTFLPDAWDNSTAAPGRQPTVVTADVEISVDGVPGDYGSESTYSATRRWTVRLETGGLGLYWLVCGVDTHGELWPRR